MVEAKVKANDRYTLELEHTRNTFPRLSADLGEFGTLCSLAPTGYSLTYLAYYS